MTPLPPQDPNQPLLPFYEPTEPVPPEPHAPAPFASFESPESETAPEPLLFRSFTAFAPPDERIPNLGQAALLALFAICGLLCAIALTQIAIHFHLFGVHNIQQASDDIHYTLGTEAVIYLIALLLCLPIFPLVWHKSFFQGIHWRGQTALRLRYRLFAAAALCFLLAMLNGVVMPGPANAPIDRLFRTPGAAWLLFGFGVTFAPFFEELAFRGFLLPAFCTAYDWMTEQLTARTPRQPHAPAAFDSNLPSIAAPEFLSTSGPAQANPFAHAIAAAVLALPFAAFLPTRNVGFAPRAIFVSLWILAFGLWWASTVLRHSPRAASLVPPLDPNGHPNWSLPAMTFSAVLTSLPFALMHGQQTSYALGPFLLLIAVSIVLCAVRLFTRSLACSVLVHASYNFLLFGFMFLGTSGFHHLDRM